MFLFPHTSLNSCVLCLILLKFTLKCTSSNGLVVQGSIFDIYNLQAHSVGCGFESCRVNTVPLLHPPPPLPQTSGQLWLPRASTSQDVQTIGYPWLTLGLLGTKITASVHINLQYKYVDGGKGKLVGEQPCPKITTIVRYPVCDVNCVMLSV